jgi:ATP-dependent DNA helicase RecG
MEKRGSGFQKITTHTSELRLYSKDLAPSFESDASSFFTTVYSVLYGKTDVDFQRIIDQESTPKADNSTPKATQKGEDTTQKTTQKKSSTTQKPIGETAQKILDLLTGDPYLTRQAMASILNLTPDGVKYHLNKLQRDGYLERKEGRKTGRWIVLIKK